MIALDKIQKFQLFCLETYRIEMNISGYMALNQFRKFNVFSFLKESFECLHTQSKDYLVSEIKEFIENRK
ncbi:MAG: DUF3791 domain-containing protein [Bacteroidales bacterium]|nr:DUF3791 domain-containing protein [Bacteroidales bacterium]